MPRTLATLCCLIVCLASTSALAGLEELPTAGAREAIEQTSGVVVVDLFSPW